MKIKSFFAFLIILSLCCQFCGCTSGKQKGAVFLDSTGEIIGNVSVTGEIEVIDDYNYSYITSAMVEVVEILSNKMNLSADEVYQKMYNGNYTIQTNLQPDLQKETYNLLSGENTPETYSVDITDLSGKLIASVCSEEGKVRQAHYPCSALKPLSVYAPLLDLGEINCSSVQIDSFVKSVDGEPWPENATGAYTQSAVTVAEAVSKSYNTIAVKWLQHLTAKDSCAFLEALGVNVSIEKEIVSKFGDDEVLSNLGLGYLHSGVTSKDMAGYYRIFALNGEYIKPSAIDSVKSGNKTVYTNSYEKKQIIKSSTAYIMRQLLFDVVNSGTGTQAIIDGIDVGGKTGTSSGNADNWFVGFTPDYVCAVWHGVYKENNETVNIAPRLFAEILRNHSIVNTTYPDCDEVVQFAYCQQSGLKFSDGCTRIGRGYYLSTEEFPSCNIH